MQIRQVNNGFIVEVRGGTYIASTLLDAAKLAGEQVADRTVYAEGCSKEDVFAAYDMAWDGRKIEAIKRLRSTFTPILGLKEAMQIIEVMIGK